MANVTIPVTTLTKNTLSADLLDGAQVIAVPAADTFTITLPTGQRPSQMFLAVYGDDNGAATVTFNAGDNPPSVQAGGGALALTVTNGLAYVFCLDQSRFTQSDGTITGTVTTKSVEMGVFFLPDTI